MTRVKICGLSTPESVDAAVAAGAAYLGFVFFPKSPRHVMVETARALALLAPPGVVKTALVVNPNDALIAEITALPVDMIQLHGAETPERARAIRAATGLPVMKALGVGTAADLAAIDAYIGAVDQLLIDAKPPPGGDLPGGNGLSFDWRLVADRDWPLPWMLAGGLSDANVAEAIRLTGARQVDVSSGVETAPGIKDAARIAAFVAAAKSASLG